MNKKSMRILLVSYLLSFSLSGWAQEPMIDLVPYCTYGVVTGILMGGASLAISEDPASNLSPIVKGASLGLYVGAGIALFKYWTLNQRKTRIDFGKKNEKSTDSLEDYQTENNTEKENKVDFAFIPDSGKISFLMQWKF